MSHCPEYSVYFKYTNTTTIKSDFKNNSEMSNFHSLIFFFSLGILQFHKSMGRDAKGKDVSSW